MLFYSVQQHQNYICKHIDMGMDQYLLIPFLGEWTSIYQLFWCELQGYKVLTHCHIRFMGESTTLHREFLRLSAIFAAAQAPPGLYSWNQGGQRKNGRWKTWETKMDRCPTRDVAPPIGTVWESVGESVGEYIGEIFRLLGTSCFFYRRF